MTAKKTITMVLLLVALSGCEQPFDPRGPIDQQMVVFGVLSTDRDVQFVSVDLNYMPAGFDPNAYTSDIALKDVFVTLINSGKMYEFRDTLIARPDTSRFKFPIHTHALNPFTIRPGQTYQLVVQSLSMGVANATVTVPDNALLDSTLSMMFILNQPFSHFPNESITFPASLSKLSKGYYARFYICYDVLKGSQWTEESVDVPISSADTVAYSLDLPIYPPLSASPSTGKLNFVYKNGFLLNVIKNLTTVKYKSNRLVFKWMVFVLIQMDQNLHNYYSFVTEYRDPRSVRLDQPSYSGINGGMGFVGAYTVDSIVYVLPPNFSGNR